MSDTYTVKIDEVFLLIAWKQLVLLNHPPFFAQTSSRLLCYVYACPSSLVYVLYNTSLAHLDATWARVLMEVPLSP